MPRLTASCQARTARDDVGRREAGVLVQGEHGVGVEVGEGGPDAGVEGRGDTGVGLPDHADARALLEGGDDVEPRGRAVVDDHDALDLRRDLVDQPGQPRPGVVRRDDGHDPEVLRCATHDAFPASNPTLL